MKVITSQGDHVTYQHFIDGDYRALLEIERQSKARALKTSAIICIDNCKPVWMLTVQDIKI